MSYDDVVERFLKYLLSIDRSSETIDGYGKELGYFSNFLLAKYSSEREMHEIVLEDLEDYMLYIKEKGKMSATRNRVIYIFRSFYNYAYKRGYCSEQLPLLLEPIKIKQKERFYLNPDQVEILFSNIEKPILKAAIETMYYTGMRVSELTSLELKDIDMLKRVIYIIDGKGKKDRTIPMSKKLYLILEEYLENTRPQVDSEKFFATRRTGSLSAQYINYSLKKAQESMDLEKRVSAHILRHSFASSMIRANVPLPYLQKLLGHADLRVTSLYIHQDIEELRFAVEKI